ncbi:MAG: MBL fold metallo-hydrolase [Candidatus Aminicenantes bacterium]|jgi:glyoxylase-like metal-dependent hydrolase (beta-lactamase superfamily II)
MKLNKAYVIGLSLIFIFSAVWADSNDNIPVQVKRISQRVIVLSETFMANNVVAIASKKGLIVVDTTGLPTTMKKMRHLIEQEFSRHDFAYVINTHYHWDHTFGNQVFPDAIIVGHENCIVGMKRDRNNLPRRTENLKRNVERQKMRLEGLDRSSDEFTNVSANIVLLKQAIEDYAGGFDFDLPAITFSDRLTLGLEDITIKMYFFGRAHSGSDILIHIPEEKLLLTGDLFLDGNWLPLFAGQPNLDIPRWIEVLNTVLDEQSEVNQVIPGHQHFWSRERLEMWRDYIAGLWEGVEAAKAEGLEFKEVKKRFPLEDRYYYLKDLGHTDQELLRFQERNIEAFWKQLFESAALVMEKVIEESGIEAGVKKYLSMKAEQETQYYFGENDFNALGYRLMGRGGIEAAIEVFKLNADAFPDSWNVYDSLGEAYMTKGDKELAIKYYKKSLDLNPENNNAKEILKRLGEKN